MVEIIDGVSGLIDFIERLSGTQQLMLIIAGGGLFIAALQRLLNPLIRRTS